MDACGNYLPCTHQSILVLRARGGESVWVWLIIQYLFMDACGNYLPCTHQSILVLRARITQVRRECVGLANNSISLHGCLWQLSPVHSSVNISLASQNYSGEESVWVWLIIQYLFMDACGNYLPCTHQSILVLRARITQGRRECVGLANNSISLHGCLWQLSPVHSSVNISLASQNYSGEERVWGSG